jgi:hypothetical protein
MRLVILPQALRTVIPSIVGFGELDMRRVALPPDPAATPRGKLSLETLNR